MSIPSYRLPESIERGSQFSPTFQNIIQEALAGNEQRLAQWTRCRGVGDISYGLMDSLDADGDFKAVVALYRAHFGSLLPFRFRDWSDYQAKDEVFGTGDGATTAFQLSKTYDPSLILLGVAGSLFYVREIVLLASTPVIEVDGVTKTVTTDYTISDTGLVTFTSAPANGKVLTWTGEFDVPVRFDGPLTISMSDPDRASIGSLPIKEVIGET